MLWRLGGSSVAARRAVARGELSSISKCNVTSVVALAQIAN
jgi:hypothetical protein